MRGHGVKVGVRPKADPVSLMFLERAHHCFLGLLEQKHLNLHLEYNRF